MVTEEFKEVAKAARLVEHMPDPTDRFRGLPGMQEKARRMHGDYREGFADGLHLACDIMRGKFFADDARLHVVEGFLARRAEETEVEPY